MCGLCAAGLPVFPVPAASRVFHVLRECDCVCVLLTSPALPAKFIDGLKNEEATEGTTATLSCELSKAAPVTWKKGTKTLRDGDKYGLRQDGAVCELQIRGLSTVDAGEYSCVCGQERTSATLTVRGKDGLVFMLLLSCAPSSMCGTAPAISCGRVSTY